MSHPVGRSCNPFSLLLNAPISQNEEIEYQIRSSSAIAKRDMGSFDLLYSAVFFSSNQWIQAGPGSTTFAPRHAPSLWKPAGPGVFLQGQEAVKLPVDTSTTLAIFGQKRGRKMSNFTSKDCDHFFISPFFLREIAKRIDFLSSSFYEKKNKKHIISGPKSRHRSTQVHHLRD